MTATRAHMISVFLNDRATVLRRTVIIVVAVLFAVLGIGYVFGPFPPFGFYYDLGVNIAATQLMDASIRSLADVKDAIGWSTWDNGTQFAFNPMFTYVFLVPLSKLLAHNAIHAVKAMQVVDTLIAFFGMFFLYATIRPRSTWASVAGVLYAALPLTVLQIQGNVEFGLATALAPLALAVCLRIIRSCGSLGLPLCGAIASLAGACIAIEYFFFLSLPLYAFTVFATDGKRRGKWLFWAVVGLLASGLTVSYCIVPTLASHTLFSDPAQRMSTLQDGQYEIFSGTVLSLLSLVLKESLIVNPPFNASPDIHWAMLGTFALWCCAIVYVAGGIVRRKMPRWEIALIVTCIVCLFLSFGANFPPGGILWSALTHVPILAYIRTPDRFIALPAVCIVLWAVLTGETFASSRERFRLIAIVGVTFVVCCFTMFGFFRHALQTDPTLQDKEPDLAAVNARVASLGGRNVSLNFIRSGSIYYFPTYGYSAPQLRLAWDLAGRYLTDGAGAAGIFGRLGVRSIVATPNWTTDDQAIPNPLSLLSRSTLLSGEMIGSNSVYVYALNDAKGYVYPEEPACYYGGPGNLDRIDGMSQFRNVSLLRDSQNCKYSVLSDFDPRDVLPRSPGVKRWSGNVLFSAADRLRDADYTFIQGRSFFNNPWYRNSIDGDAPVFDAQGAVALSPGDRATMSLSGSGSSQVLALHLACHTSAVLDFEMPNQRAQRVACYPAAGFQWLTIQVPAFRQKAVHATLSLVESTGPALHGTQWGVAFDGAILHPKGHDSSLDLGSGPAAIVLTANHFAIDDREMHTVPVEGSLVEVARRGFVHAVGTSPATSSAPSLTAYSTNSSITYRWSGPPGTYLVSGSAWISGHGATFSVVREGTSGRGRIAIYDPSSSVPTSVWELMQLKTGDRIQFNVTLPQGDPNAAASFVGASVSALSPSSTGEDGSGDEAYSWDLGGVVPQGPLDIDLAEAAFHNRPTLAVLEVNASGRGTGLAVLTCNGSKPAVLRLQSPSAAEGVMAQNIRACKITLQLTDPNLRITNVRLTGRGTTVSRRSASRWLPAGKYSVEAVTATGLPITSPFIEFDGRPIGKHVSLKSSGWHSIVLKQFPTTLSMLLFTSASWGNPALAVPAVSQVAAARWSVDVAAESTLETAVIPDGYWTLSAKDKRYAGKPCDLVNTCFSHVAPGRYLLSHRWPASTIAGVFLSLSMWILGFGIAFLGYGAERRPR